MWHIDAEIIAEKLWNLGLVAVVVFSAFHVMFAAGWAS